MLDTTYLLTMYISVTAIDLTPSGTKYPDFYVILICHFIFMVLYFLWDVTEHNVTKLEVEKKYYVKVMLWEFASTILLAYLLWRQAQSICTSNWLVLSLGAITLLFVLVAVEKQKYYNLKPAS